VKDQIDAVDRPARRRDAQSEAEQQLASREVEIGELDSGSGFEAGH
jgi:hypothetical protein